MRQLESWVVDSLMDFKLYRLDKEDLDNIKFIKTQHALLRDKSDDIVVKFAIKDLARRVL